MFFYIKQQGAIASPNIKPRAPYILTPPEQALFSIKLMQKDLLIALAKKWCLVSSTNNLLTRIFINPVSWGYLILFLFIQALPVAVTLILLFLS